MYLAKLPLRDSQKHLFQRKMILRSILQGFEILVILLGSFGETEAWLETLKAFGRLREVSIVKKAE